jgi:hypothetical protein
METSRQLRTLRRRRRLPQISKLGHGTPQAVQDQNNDSHTIHKYYRLFFNLPKSSTEGKPSGTLTNTTQFQGTGTGDNLAQLPISSRQPNECAHLWQKGLKDIPDECKIGKFSSFASEWRASAFYIPFETIPIGTQSQCPTTIPSFMHYLARHAPPNLSKRHLLVRYGKA